MNTKHKYPWCQDPNTIPESKKVIGFITDIHLPYSKWEYIEQVIDLFLQMGVNIIVNGGDFHDKHNLSQHDSHPDAIGTMTEYDLTMNMLEKFKEHFPYMYIITGNHCRRTDRQAAKLGIPKHFLKTDSTLYNYPETWVVQEYFIINNVKYEHGEVIGGELGHKRTSQNNQISTCMGHLHSNCGVEYYNNGTSQKFGLAGGCLVDKESYAFAYGKNSKLKPILACSVIFNDSFAITIPINE